MLAIFTTNPGLCTEFVGHEDEPRCMLVCPADCFIPDRDRRGSQDELFAKYQSMHG